MTPAETWLRARLSDAPAELLDAMAAALPADADADAPVPDVLAAAALALLERVATSSGGREDALPLLTADALLTHALEAQAEADPAGVAAFAERWGGAGRMGTGECESAKVRECGSAGASPAGLEPGG